MILGMTRIGLLRSWGRRFPIWLQAPLKRLVIAAEGLWSSAVASIPVDIQPIDIATKITLAEPTRRGPFISHAEHVFGVERAGSLHPTARLFVRERADGTFGKLVLGPGTYLGTEVEIAALGRISIGRDTSIQNYCVIHGDVSLALIVSSGHSL